MRESEISHLLEVLTVWQLAVLIIAKACNACDMRWPRCVEKLGKSANGFRYTMQTLYPGRLGNLR